MNEAVNHVEDIKDLIHEVRLRYWKGNRRTGSGRHSSPPNCLILGELPALFYQAYLQIDNASIPTGIFEEIHKNQRILNEKFFQRLATGTLAKYSVSLRKYNTVLTRCLSVLLEREITQFVIQDKLYGAEPWRIRPDEDEQEIARAVIDAILELEHPTLRELKALHLAERSVNLSLGVSLTVEQCREILARMARTSTRDQ